MPQPRILVVDDNPELLALLSSAFEEAGYAVSTALRGRNALDSARKERPDLAVIDVLLPDLMGFDVAEALKKMKVPFIFMSGVHKGGKAASNAVGKYGALGYFEKPFERSAMLELVEKIIPARAPVQSQAWDVESAPGVDEATDAMSLTGRIDLISAGTTASIRGKDVNLKAIEALQIARTRPPGPMAPPVMGPVSYAQAPAPPPVMAPGPPAPSASVPGSGLQTLPPPAPAAFSSPPPPPPEALQDLQDLRGPVRRGELKDNLPQLFAAFLQAKETGELGLQRGQVKKIIYFEQGMPVFALSNLVADRLGQFLVRAGKIDEETLKHAAEEAHSLQQRTGDVLILMGLLTEQDRLYYIGQQIKSILYSLFAWEEGLYQLSFQARARKETIKLDLHPATLIMRGIRKLYKPDRLRRILGAEDKPLPSPDPLFNLSDVELQGWEAHLIAKCDGTRTVAQLVAGTGKPENEALATLVGLVSLHILEVRR